MARRLFLVPALLAAMVTVSCFGGSRPKRIGEMAPDFTLQDSDRKVVLSGFRGQVVLLNFWATWCPPCDAELPSLMIMQERVRSRGVMVLGVSIDVDGDAYHRFLKQHNVNFLTVRDPEQRISSMYGTSGWPETYIIDRQGVLRRKIVGPTDWTSPDMLEFLNHQ
jgi:cytochrome c biogenesis protein CcmG, thiol:disulfide interchange protein DsbE